LSRLAVVVLCVAVFATGSLAAARPVNLGAQLPIKRSVRSDACTVYVSPNGHRGRRRGRSPHRPTSLRWAVDHARPGAVVCLERGTYRTYTNVELARSGRPGHPITIKGYRSRPLISYVGRQRQSGGVLQTTVCRPWCASHDLVIEHLGMYGRDLMESGVFARMGARDIAVVDCVISHTGSSGISLNGIDHAFVAGNLIYHAGYGLGWSSGISLWYGAYGGPSAASDGAPGFHNYIVGNIVSGSYDNSFHHSDGHGVIVDGSGFAPPALIANNVVYENGGAGIIVARTSGSMWLVNNTGYANGLDKRISTGYAGDFMAVSATDVYFVNNLAYGRRRGRAYTYNNTNSNIAWSHNLGYAGPTTGVAPSILHDRSYYLYANPRFVQLPQVPGGRTPWAHAVPPWRLGHAFRLSRGSAAVARGVSPSHVSGITAVLAAGLRVVGLM